MEKLPKEKKTETETHVKQWNHWKHLMESKLELLEIENNTHTRTHTLLRYQ